MTHEVQAVSGLTEGGDHHSVHLTLTSEWPVQFSPLPAAGTLLKGNHAPSLVGSGKTEPFLSRPASPSPSPSPGSPQHPTDHQGPGSRVWKPLVSRRPQTSPHVPTAVPWLCPRAWV